MSPSIGQFVGKILHGGLIVPEQLHTILARMEGEGLPLTEERLVNRLHEEGKLTNYQMVTLLEGKSEDLSFGNYVILDRLGAGGMGTVYKAMHRRMKRIVAIKVLLRAKTRLPDQVAQFQCEVEAVARLSHPNIVTAHDADECSLGHFLVMEYVPGPDLAQVAAQHGPLPLAEGVDYILQAARALEYAHGQGIVHCDVKPANLLRDPRNTIKVTDLGLARFALNSSSETRLGLSKNTISGTLDFMSPEQGFNPSAVDHRSDIYSLGCSLFYLLTRQVLFGGQTIMEKLGARLQENQRSLGEFRKDVPATLEAIYRRMVARDVDQRYQSMTEVITDLEACDLPQGSQNSEPISSKPIIVVGTQATSWPGHQAVALADLSVLLVEPSRFQARVIEAQLQELGVKNLQTATGGQAALAMMLNTRPDIVISSMHLTDMTGADMVQKMREQDELQQVAFVLISSETDGHYLEPVRQAGTAAILAKPFDVRRLKQALTVAADFFSPGRLRAHNLNVSSLKVLVVDDSRAARSHIRRVLENMGMTSIQEANSGAQAIYLVDTTEFDLVVTDYNMPEMDGPTLVRYLRADKVHRNRPILMITSETDPACLVEAHAAGVSAVCSKVFDPQRVCGILEKILAKPVESV